MELDKMSRLKVTRQINKYFEEKREDSPHENDFAFPVSISGLACRLEVDKQEILNISPKSKHYESIENAKRKIEAYYENQLARGKSATGIMFILKTHFGWNDKENTYINTEDNSLDLKELSSEELLKLADM